MSNKQTFADGFIAGGVSVFGPRLTERTKRRNE
jgi:hypothetical protein